MFGAVGMKHSETFFHSTQIPVEKCDIREAERFFFFFFFGYHFVDDVIFSDRSSLCVGAELNLEGFFFVHS